MNKLRVVILYLTIALAGCKNQYQETEAKIIDLKIEDGDYKALVEYYVDGVRYTDEFDISSEKIISDSISTPHPGLVFNILYDPSNPERNKIDFKVKANYLESE